nr:unnamed protein product [Callosobruchus analis]
MLCNLPTIIDFQSTSSIRPNFTPIGTVVDDKETFSSPSLRDRSGHDRPSDSGSGATEKETTPEQCEFQSYSYAADKIGLTESISYDVGEFIGKQTLDHIKYQFLENPWRPPPNYKFPYSLPES